MLQDDNREKWNAFDSSLNNQENDIWLNVNSPSYKINLFSETQNNLNDDYMSNLLERFNKHFQVCYKRRFYFIQSDIIDKT